MLLKNSEWLPEMVAVHPEPVAQPAGTLGELAARAVTFLAEAAGMFADWRRRRETNRRLAELDDRMLQDVGIARSDLPGWTTRGIGGWASFDPRRTEPRRQ
jgi:uncharacterized protein YjiS (DUF1127 family)